MSSIPIPTQHTLRTLKWIGRKENVVVCGPSGTGNTFFLDALGQQVVESGMRVAWLPLEDLGALVRAHRSDDSVHRVVETAYEKRSIVVSSNLHLAGFDKFMPKTLAIVTADWLFHRAHVCQTWGDSIRIT